jgi:hypothetical protein
VGAVCWRHRGYWWRIHDCVWNIAACNVKIRRLTRWAAGSTSPGLAGPTEMFSSGDVGRRDAHPRPPTRTRLATCSRMGTRSMRTAIRWCPVVGPDMDLRELVVLVVDRVARFGFRVVDERLGGPMGSGRVRLSDGACVVDLISDRGVLAITLGRSGGEDTWSIETWAEVLGIEMDEYAGIAEEVDFVVERLPTIEEVLATDPGVDTRLRDVNWRRVKDHLGLDADTPGRDLPTIPDEGRSSRARSHCRAWRAGRVADALRRLPGGPPHPVPLDTLGPAP